MPLWSCIPSPPCLQIHLSTGFDQLIYNLCKKYLHALPRELSAFPGPLKPGVTHKNDVIKFCERKITASRGRADIADRESYILLWEMLILMLRQKGQVDSILWWLFHASIIPFLRLKALTWLTFCLETLQSKGTICMQDRFGWNT